MLGVVLFFHGLAHAGLPLRGSGFNADSFWDWLSVALYVVALLGFLATGLCLLGALPFRRLPAWWPAVPAGASILALMLSGYRDLWPGVLISAPLAAAAHRLLAKPRPDRAPKRRVLARVLNAGSVLFFTYAAVATLTWSWHRSWGVTKAEWAMTLPGDRSPRDPALEVMHGITIDAPPEIVWPWLAQLGQDRAGFYSYDWLERAFGVDIRNRYELRPEWQRHAAGDFVRATQPTYLGGIFGSDLGWRLDVFEPPRAMVLRGWGAFVLVPTTTGGTRFIVRSTMSSRRIPVWAAALTFTLFELPHFIMEQRMMRTIKHLAEHPPLEG
jgi:hypothetical protein